MKNDVIAFTDPRVLARMDEMERRLESLEARRRDDDHVAAELDRELTAMDRAAMLTLRPGSASGGATANDGGGA